ncbi:methyl-CpG-binding domain-containing protein 4-like [Tasmannia lanceolata]|uniref:methyl-CpG-binding domain-containing protein 4-like n=1 Tax=Tasmannia lanceolata TaxID=3420 RepID=UPI00406435E0
MKLENLGNPKSSEKARSLYNPIGAYAVQCGKCFKWRSIPTTEEYESIRHNFIENPWVCHRKAGVSCSDPADLEYDTSRIWLIDKPNIPKTPAGYERGLTIKTDLSRIDSSYTTPTGKKVRAPAEVEKFLEANPVYQGDVTVSDFNFAVPKIPAEMVLKKGSSSSYKKMKISKTEDD